MTTVFTGGVAFVPKQNQSSSNTNNGQDRLVVVERYNFSQNILEVVDVQKGWKMHVSIDPEQVRRNDESIADRKITAPWFGHKIDEKMAKSIPPGSKVVLERAKLKRKINHGNEDVYIMQANRILNVINPEPEKTFYGLFTISEKKDADTGQMKVSAIQHWEPKAVSVDDKEGIEKIRGNIAEALSYYGKKVADKPVVNPTVGVQFRAVVDDGETCTVVDTTPPFDWFKAQKDESGNVVKEAHALDVETFDTLLAGYMDYIRENTNLTPYLDKLHVEVCQYKNYWASGFMKYPTNDKDPIYKLLHTKTRLTMDPNTVVTGKNYAVNGIIQLSQDDFAKVGGQPVIIQRNFVHRLHANNAAGHLHAWIRNAENKKCNPHEMLKKISDNAPAKDKDNKPELSRSAAPAADEGKPVVNSIPNLSGNGFGEEDDDPFALPEPTETVALASAKFGKKS